MRATHVRGGSPVDTPFHGLAGSAAMSRALSALVLGVCVFGTAYAVQRIIAPFAGLSLALFSGDSITTMLGCAIGCAAGAGVRPSVGSGPFATRALLAAAVLTLLTALLHRAMLVALWRADVRLTIALASVAFAGLPSIC